MSALKVPCTECDGDGWYVMPDPRDASGSTPRQEQCDCCRGEGVHVEKVVEE